jgi:hypothetical protein
LFEEKLTADQLALNKFTKCLVLDEGAAEGLQGNQPGEIAAGHNQALGAEDE